MIELTRDEAETLRDYVHIAMGHSEWMILSGVPRYLEEYADIVSTLAWLQSRIDKERRGHDRTYP